MATYTPDDLISHDLACPICFEDYDILCRQRAPKLLLCLHTFCFGCAQRLWQPNGTLECSLCRTVHSGVALNELFDNPVILEHLRKECEEQDMELARRLDMEMRNRERHIFNSVPPPPPPLNDMVQLQSEEDDSDEEEEGDGDEVDGLQDMADDGLANIFDSDATVEEEEDEEEEEEEEEESGHEGRMNDLLDRCIGGMLDAVTNVVQGVDGVVERIDEIDDAEEAIDDSVEEIDDSVVEIDDGFDGVDQIDEILEGQDHEDDDESSSSSSSSDDEQEDMMEDLRLTLSWNPMEPPHVQSEEEEEEEEEENNEACQENDDNVEEEEEEDRWYSASELVMSPQWVEDDFSMDDDAPDSPDIAAGWLLL